jgi:hypothetical protein
VAFELVLALAQAFAIGFDFGSEPAQIGRVLRGHAPAQVQIDGFVGHVADRALRPARSPANSGHLANATGAHHIQRMQFLGVMRGHGMLTSSNDGQDYGPAEYDIDGFRTQTGEVMASGELRLPSERLAQAFGRNDLRLRTEDGSELTLRFSGKQVRDGADAAHIDVTGGLPPLKKWRR